MPQQYLETIFQHKWLILGCFFLGITCGLMFYLTQEKIYRGEALLVFQVRDGEAFQFSASASAVAQEEVSGISQMVLSHANLASLIDEEQLHPESRGDTLPLRGVEEMRDNIRIASQPNENIITIQYLGRDPAQVARVANWLAESYIEQGIKYQQERALEMSALVREKLEKMQIAIAGKETELQDYKLRYYYEMPEKQELNKSRLISLRDKYKTNQESISLLKRKKEIVLEQIRAGKQLAEDKQRQESFARIDGQQPGTSRYIDQRGKLDALRSSLMELQRAYTDQHPMMIRLKKQIDEIELALEDLERESGDIAVKDIIQGTVDDSLLSLENQLKDINLNISELEKENYENQVLINKLEELIASAPVREKEWSVMTKEFDRLKDQHDLLVAQDLNYASMLAPSGRAKMNRYKIENPVRVPASPIKPSLVVITLASALIGLFIGGIIAIGLNVRDATFKTQVELEKSFDIPIICSVPHLPLTEERVNNRIRSALRSGLYLIWFSALCSALIVLR